LRTILLAAAGEFSLSPEDEERAFSIAEQFADCSGAYFAFAEVMKLLDMPETGTSIPETGNDPYLP
jgi:hypothetical protein